MSSVIRFCEKRQIGFTKHVSIPSQFNYDFLFEKFSCKKTDVYSLDDETDVPPFSCKFKEGTGTLAISMEDGYVSLLDTEATSSTRLLHSWKAHQNAVFDICWVPKQGHLVTASGDHSCVLWDAIHGERIATYVNNVGSVKCVDVCHTQGNLIATGSRDGAINIWDKRVNCNNVNKKPEIFITDAHCLSHGDENRKPKNRSSNMYHSKLRSVTGVVFQDEHHLCSAGVGDQKIKLWDLRRTYVVKAKGSVKHSPKHSMMYAGDGCTSIAFDSNYQYLYACSTNSVIYNYNCHAYETAHLACYTGLRVATYFIKLDVSPDDSYLVCGSSDENGYIWKVKQPGPPICKLSGHTAEVTAVSWHPNDITKLATCGDDNRTLLWRASGKKDVLEVGESVGSAEIVFPENASITLSQSSSSSSHDEKIASPSQTKTLKNFFGKAPSLNSEHSNDVPLVLKVKCDDESNSSRSVLSPKSIATNLNISNSTSNSPTSGNFLRYASGKSPSHFITKTPSRKRSSASPSVKRTAKKAFQKSERLITSYFQ